MQPRPVLKCNLGSLINETWVYKNSAKVLGVGYKYPCWLASIAQACQIFLNFPVEGDLDDATPSSMGSQHVDLVSQSSHCSFAMISSFAKIILMSAEARGDRKQLMLVLVQ